MTANRCVAILAGTEDIHQPLYVALSQTLEQPVFLLEAGDDTELRQRLIHLAQEFEVWVFPSNEVTLNRAAAVLQQIPDCDRLHLPGTAQQNRVYTAAELSDKAILAALRKGHDFQTFQPVTSHVLRLGDWQTLASLEALPFPLLLKPATKDATDAFTQVFPEKVLILNSVEHLKRLLQQELAPFCDRQFILQSFIDGVPLSWCGYITRSSQAGHRIRAVVKSPVGSIGGTTTLATLEPMLPALDKAVSELASLLSLEGIFEIEFILKDDRLYFFDEINPRPWLQVGLLLHSSPNLFSEYLIQHGFTGTGRTHLSKRREWGSTNRYLLLNPRSAIALNRLLQTLRSDIRYSRFFSLKQKLKYTRSLVKLLLKKVLLS